MSLEPPQERRPRSSDVAPPEVVAAGVTLARALARYRPPHPCVPSRHTSSGSGSCSHASPLSPQHPSPAPASNHSWSSEKLNLARSSEELLASAGPSPVDEHSRSHSVAVAEVLRQQGQHPFIFSSFPRGAPLSAALSTHALPPQWKEHQPPKHTLSRRGHTRRGSRHPSQEVIASPSQYDSRQLSATTLSSSSPLPKLSTTSAQKIANVQIAGTGFLPRTSAPTILASGLAASPPPPSSFPARFASADATLIHSKKEHLESIVSTSTSLSSNSSNTATATSPSATKRREGHIQRLADKWSMRRLAGEDKGKASVDKAPRPSKSASLSPRAAVDLALETMNGSPPFPVRAPSSRDAQAKVPGARAGSVPQSPVQWGPAPPGRITCGPPHKDGGHRMSMAPSVADGWGLGPPAVPLDSARRPSVDSGNSEEDTNETLDGRSILGWEYTPSELVDPLDSSDGVLDDSWKSPSGAANVQRGTSILTVGSGPVHVRPVFPPPKNRGFNRIRKNSPAWPGNTGDERQQHHMAVAVLNSELARDPLPLWEDVVGAATLKALPREEIKRQSAMYELFQTQHQLVLDLHVISDVVIPAVLNGTVPVSWPTNPGRRLPSAGHDIGLGDGAARRTFVQEVLRGVFDVQLESRKLLASLKKRFVQAGESRLVSSVGDVLLTTLLRDEFGRSFEAYAVSYRAGRARIERELKTNTRFKAFWSDLCESPSLRKLPWDHFHQKPTIWFQRCVLQLEALVKFATDPADAGSLQEAVVLMKDYNFRINAQIEA